MRDFRMRNVLKKTVVFAGCVFVLFGGACSGSSATPPVALEQFPTQFGDAYCDSLAPCCASAHIPYDSATCKNAATAFFKAYATANAVPGKTYDAAAAGGCLSAFKALLQSCSKSDDDTANDACAKIFVGSVPAGGACQQNSDCAGGNCVFDPSDPNGGSVCGTQTGQAHAKAGEGCNGDCFEMDGSEDCSSFGVAGGAGTAGGTASGTGTCFASDGLFCSTRSGVCTVFAQVGQACEEEGCVAGAFCDAGTCAAQRDSGPCDSFEACSSKSYCDSATNQCTAKKADGAACAEPSDCSSGDCSASAAGSGTQVCGTSSVASTSTCAGNLN